MSEPPIRFNQPTLEGREVEYIQQAVLGGGEVRLVQVERQHRLQLGK